MTSADTTHIWEPDMRDRLGHLHKVLDDSEGFSTEELEDPSEPEAATAAAAETSNRDQELDGVLQEAQQIRLEVQQIQHDICDLKEVNYHALNNTQHLSATKRDSNAIGADIKRRGEAVLQRLHKLKALSGEAEAQRGSSDPVARIARTQYQCLGNALQEVIFNYNDTEMSHREACKRQIRRQLEVVGREVSEEDMEEMMESGQWGVFSVQVEGRTARSALVQIEHRHKELQDLESRIQTVQELFLDVAVLTQEQGTAIENIHVHVQNTGAAIQDSIVYLDRATTYDKNNPFKRLFCGCFPCYRN